MIIDLIIFIFVNFLSFLLTVFAGVLNFVVDITNYDIAEGLAYLFGNLMLFDSVLPIHETLYLTAAALAWKASLFAYDVFWFTVGFVGRIKNVFITWR